MSEYGDGYVTADRQPENRARFALDAEGFVCRAYLCKPGEGEEFMAVMVATRDAFPLDPADVEMHGCPVDEDGRGFSVLEVTRGHHLTIPISQRDAA